MSSTSRSYTLLLRGIRGPKRFRTQKPKPNSKDNCPGSKGVVYEPGTWIRVPILSLICYHHAIVATSSNEETLIIEHNGYVIEKTRINDHLLNSYEEYDIPENHNHRKLIIQRAEAYIGSTQYHYLYDNCESFCNHCYHGKKRSKQGEHATATAVGMPFTVIGAAVAHDAVSNATVPMSNLTTCKRYGYLAPLHIALCGGICAGAGGMYLGYGISYMRQ